MKCPKDLRDCPHGWTDCELCANLVACQAGAYVPEPEQEEQDPIPELEENELTVDLGVDIQSVRGTWSEQFENMTEDERWAEMYRYHPDDLISKEPYKAMAGAVVPGGGGKCRVPKKPQKKMPEYLKTFGQ